MTVVTKKIGSTSRHIGPTTSGSRARLARAAVSHLPTKIQSSPSEACILGTARPILAIFGHKLCGIVMLRSTKKKTRKSNLVLFPLGGGGRQKMGSDSPNRPRPPGGQTTYITLPYSTLSGTCRHRLQRRFPCVGGLIGNVFRLHVLSMSVKTEN